MPHPRYQKMTLPTQRSPFLNSADMDVNSLMNNREFQEMLQEYFQSNTMTLDEFLEHLPRFMMENYGLDESEDEEDEMVPEEMDDNDMDDEDVFLSFLQRAGGYRAEPINTSEVLMRSLLAGRREIREIPLRTILPQSPPPSPTPNLATTASSIPFFQRNQQRGPQVPQRPNGLRRVPSQLRNSTTPFDPNGTDKSPNASPVLINDRNNNIEASNDLPLTSEFMRRYGHVRINQNQNNDRRLIEDTPER